MVKYGKFEKMHLSGIWFCVRRKWSDSSTKCSGFDYVRENDLIVPYAEWEAEDVIQYFEEGGV